MENSIYFKDLPCYTDFEFAENSRVYKNRNRIIHLESIPTDGLRQELRSFIEYRGNGTTIKASSLISELWKFHMVLASETKSMRQTMDEILANLIEGW